MMKKAVALVFNDHNLFCPGRVKRQHFGFRIPPAWPRLALGQSCISKEKKSFKASFQNICPNPGPALSSKKSLHKHAADCIAFLSIFLLQPCDA
jgi:hypothetical protein